MGETDLRFLSRTPILVEGGNEAAILAGASTSTSEHPAQVGEKSHDVVLTDHPSGLVVVVLSCVGRGTLGAGSYLKVKVDGAQVEHKYGSAVFSTIVAGSSWIHGALVYVGALPSGTHTITGIGNAQLQTIAVTVGVALVGQQ